MQTSFRGKSSGNECSLFGVLFIVSLSLPLAFGGVSAVGESNQCDFDFTWISNGKCVHLFGRKTPVCLFDKLRHHNFSFSTLSEIPKRTRLNCVFVSFEADWSGLRSAFHAERILRPFTSIFIIKDGSKSAENALGAREIDYIYRNALCTL